MKAIEKQKDLAERIASVDWDEVRSRLSSGGFASVPGLLSAAECDELKAGYDDIIHRKRVVMERHRYGKGEYKYYAYPLPEQVETLRREIYPELVPVANDWMSTLNIDVRFPADLAALKTLCERSRQTMPTPLMLKYGKGGFNTLHQDLYGEVWFPMQCAVFLDRPDIDYTGGEFVLTEQIPRAQSKAMVLRPKQGDMLIFTTNFRAEKGSRGHYRVAMRHGVSEIHSGSRHTLGIIFHDAVS